MKWSVREKTFDLERRGMVMGILNVTPDSFSDGGSYCDDERAVEAALKMVEDGAEIIDVGGESTRPGAAAISPVEEMSRVLPVIEKLRSRSEVLISIDSSKARVAEAALNAGADIINDVSGGLRDEDMMPLWARKDCGIVLMHSQGRPETMQDDPSYTDVVAEVTAFFYQQWRKAAEQGVEVERVLFDPGIGFGKGQEHNLALLGNLEELRAHGRPLLLGVSRKSFIARVLEDEAMNLRDWPTVALTAASYGAGCRVFRVHDVRPNVEALRMVEAIENVTD